jgi:predicted ATPase
MLVIGEPGIGKTRLAQEIAGGALAAGHAVAWGRCVEADGAPPYWPWLQILRTLGLDTDALSTTVESPEERFSRYDEVTTAIAGTGTERATVIVIDDAHWANEPSLLLLRHVASRVAELRLLRDRRRPVARAALPILRPIAGNRRAETGRPHRTQHPGRDRHNAPPLSRRQCSPRGGQLQR